MVNAAAMAKRLHQLGKAHKEETRLEMAQKGGQVWESKTHRAGGSWDLAKA